MALGKAATVSAFDAATGDVLRVYSGTAGSTDMRYLDGVLLVRTGGGKLSAIDADSGREIWAAREGSWKLHYETARPHGPMKHDPPLLFELDVDPSERYNINGHFPEPMKSIPKLIERHRAEVTPGPDLMKAIDDNARIK